LRQIKTLLSPLGSALLALDGEHFAQDRRLSRCLPMAGSAPGLLVTECSCLGSEFLLEVPEI